LVPRVNVLKTSTAGQAVLKICPTRANVDIKSARLIGIDNLYYKDRRV